MKYFPDLKIAVPPVELMVYDSPAAIDLPRSNPSKAATAFCSDTASLDQETANPPDPDQRRLIVEEFLQTNLLEPNSRRLYKRELQRFCQWTDQPFAAMTPALLDAYCTWLETTPTLRTGKPLARNSINLAITALKSFFAWLSTAHPYCCAANPAAELKGLKVQPTSPSGLNAAALTCLWESLPSLGITQYRDRLLVHLLIQGVRASELTALNLAHWDGAQLWLPATKKQSLRSVLLSQPSCLALQQYLDWRRNYLPESLSPDSPLIISLHVAHRGKRLSYIGIYQAIERLGKIASQCYAATIAASLPASPEVEQTQQQLANLHPDQLRHINQN